MNGYPFLLVAALAGCVQMQRPTQAPPVPVPAPAPVPAPPLVVEVEEAQQVTELLGYYGRVAQMNGDDQRRELNGTTQSFNRDRSSYNRTRLALLHLVPGTGFQDDARAVQLLEPLAANGSGALHRLATVLYAQTTERMKAQRRADQMKDQLEALRAIERSLIERGQQPQQPRKP